MMSIRNVYPWELFRKVTFLFRLKVCSANKLKKNRQWHLRRVPFTKTEATTHAVNGNFIFFFRLEKLNKALVWLFSNQSVWIRFYPIWELQIM